MHYLKKIYKNIIYICIYPTFLGLLQETYKAFLGLNRFIQCLSQDSETGCLKLAIVKKFGVQIFKGDYNIVRFQP